MEDLEQDRYRDRDTTCPPFVPIMRACPPCGPAGTRLHAHPPGGPSSFFFARLQFKVEEIYDFAQEDLISEDIMLLDTYAEVYVWIGTGANEAEKKDAIITAAEYVKNAPDARSGDTPIIVVKQGFEPKLFTANFQAWSADKAKVRVGAEQREREKRVGGWVRGGKETKGGWVGAFVLCKRGFS